MESTCRVSFCWCQGKQCGAAPGFPSFTLFWLCDLGEALKEFFVSHHGMEVRNTLLSEYQVPASSQLPSEHCCPATFWQPWQPAAILIAADIVTLLTGDLAVGMRQGLLREEARQGRL